MLLKILKASFTSFLFWWFYLPHLDIHRHFICSHLWRCCSSFSCCHTLEKVSKVLLSLYFLSLSTLTVSCVAVSPPAWSSSCLLVEGSCDGWPAVLFVGARVRVRARATPVLRRCCRLHGCPRSVRRAQGPQMTHWKPTPVDRLVLSLNLI